jgi:hypothetical protein
MAANEKELPRWSLALLSGFVALVCGWGASVLPWREWTPFAIITTFVAVAHGITALAAVLGHPIRRLAWRAQAIVALSYLAYLTYNLVTSASYIAELYGGLGRGVAVSLGLVWLIVIALTVPLSVWGLAVTGGVRFTRSGKAAAIVAVVLAGFGMMRSRSAAAAEPTVASADPQALASLVEDAIPPPSSRPAFPGERPSLWTKSAAECEQDPSSDIATVLAAYQGPSEMTRPEPRVVCIQAPSLQEALARLRELLEDEAYAAPVKIDVVTGVQPLRHVVPVVDSMTLRPGLDGVCELGRCLAPWQLLGQNLLIANTPIPVVPELRFGFDPIFIRRALAPPDRRGLIPVGIEGLVRIETASFVTDRQGALHRLRRLREQGPELDPENVRKALLAAEDYILGAQGDDGRFEYNLDPFTGLTSYRNFSMPRQAGTTLVVCELAQDRERAKEVATKALAMIASTEIRVGDVGMVSRKPRKQVGLGPTALSAIAFLSCRDLVGDQFDPVIARLTQFLLVMQRPDGGFYPALDTETGKPVPGPDPLYAVGQGVFALTLLEKLTADPSVRGFADHEEVKAATEAAMNYIANDYWRVFARDFFFMEENWHCLAARASLRHHRNEGYEDFCLDYVRYKTRLILDEDAGVDPDLIGGYGFGNVLLPHNTGSAGFGEAGSAAMAILEVRGEQDPEIEATLRRALAFLLHHQWTEVTSFAASTEHPIAGGFSEHMGSPVIRIDYVQHAMAGLGHGGRMLGWVDGRSY